MHSLRGTGVALITPFDQSGKIDFPALKRILAHTAKGVDYYVIMGTTGEAGTISQREKKEVLRFVHDNNEKGIPVVYGIGGNNTAEVIEIIHDTDLKGVHALLSVSPYYSKPSQEGIIRHFSAIADASPVPIILYNVPGRTSSNLTAETTLRLAAHSKIIGIKEASGNFEQCMKIVRGKKKEFMLISGDDLLTVPLYSIGAEGVISVLANAYPEIFKAMKDHAFAGNFEAASAAQFRILDINALMYEEGSPVGVKEVLSQLGICGPFVRLPHTPASESLRTRISALRKAL